MKKWDEIYQNITVNSKVKPDVHIANFVMKIFLNNNNYFN